MAHAIHHINFIVRDLDDATARFEKTLRLAPFERVRHAGRGADIARTRLGDSWLVLVCPTDDASVPGRFLADHGEGFFLLSLATDDLHSDLERLADDGTPAIDGTPRSGILDWRVADVGVIHGALLQLTDASASTS